MSVAPKFQKPLMGEARPSNWKLLTVKPRAENWKRLLSLRLTDKPGAEDSRVCETDSWPVSSMSWRVTTLTDCGVSRADSCSPVAVPVAPLV